MLSVKTVRTSSAWELVAIGRRGGPWRPTPGPREVKLYQGGAGAPEARARRKCSGLRCTSGRMKKRMGLLTFALCIVLAEGKILPDLEATWAIRRGQEAEVIVLANVLVGIARQLAAAASSGHWQGKSRYLYQNTGRALKLGSAIQHHVEVMGRYKTQCRC